MAISTVLRQAVSVEISLSNPLNEELQFMVSLQARETDGTPHQPQLRFRTHQASLLLRMQIVQIRDTGCTALLADFLKNKASRTSTNANKRSISPVAFGTNRG